jgi:hypothetical protein
MHGARALANGHQRYGVFLHLSESSLQASSTDHTNSTWQGRLQQRASVTNVVVETVVGMEPLPAAAVPAVLSDVARKQYRTTPFESKYLRLLHTDIIQVCCFACSATSPPAPETLCAQSTATAAPQAVGSTCICWHLQQRNTGASNAVSECLQRGAVEDLAQQLQARTEVSNQQAFHAA